METCQFKLFHSLIFHDFWLLFLWGLRRSYTSKNRSPDFLRAHILNVMPSARFRKNSERKTLTLKLMSKNIKTVKQKKAISEQERISRELWLNFIFSTSIPFGHKKFHHVHVRWDFACLLSLKWKDSDIAFYLCWWLFFLQGKFLFLPLNEKNKKGKENSAENILWYHSLV